MVTTCPVCRDSTLVLHELDTNLLANRCTKCGGSFVGAMEYQHWLNKRGVILPEKLPEEGFNLASEESGGVRFCPHCKYMLIKYKIGHAIDFALNKCGNCGGVWFDKNEWEILKSRNLHDEVHLMFSDAWQDAVRADEHQKAMEEIWCEHLGDDLQEIKRIKAWLLDHPNSATLFAYLVHNLDNESLKTPYN